MSEELKRCPHCGSKAVYVHSMAYDWAKCGNMNCHNTATISVRYWNTRPIEDELNARIVQLEAELARRDEELKITDGLLKEATETIGAVIACCTYNSNDDAKIGIYGIDHEAFSRIDQFMTHYIDAVSAGKVSVDVKRELSDAEINELGAQEAERRDKK